MGLFSRLKQSLVKSSNKISTGIDNIFNKKILDADILTSLEEILLSSDMGVEVTEHIIAKLRNIKFHKNTDTNEVKKVVSDIINEILAKQNHSFTLSQDKINIIMLSGVNGSGKTTTIGKLAHKYLEQGKKVGVVGCDTFRAASQEQLKKWTENTSIKFYRGEYMSDPASVAYKAVKDALENNIEILLIDTAGRLHNKKNLMDELEKIVRVIKKQVEEAPHHSILVLDGTVGQNAMSQVKEFLDIANISGIIITKLDTSSKAAIATNVVNKFNLPIHYLGIGESKQDMIEFNSESFAKAIVNIE